VLNLDLKDFFPTLEYKRIRGAFRGLSYGEAAATIFALITSEPEVDEVELDGQTFYVANGVRRLPQGAPTSPAITNVVCRRMDARLAGAAAKLGFTYTRYADDLTFSGPRSADTGAMLDRIQFVTAAEGLAEHPNKTRVLRRSRRQEVTGVVVNQQLGVDRDTLRTPTRETRARRPRAETTSARHRTCGVADLSEHSCIEEQPHREDLS
jgi:hypothetical protein